MQKLIEENVDFMLVSGYAVNFHGYNRTTADLDIWLSPDNRNKQLLLEALSALDFDEEGIPEIRN